MERLGRGRVSKRYLTRFESCSQKTRTQSTTLHLCSLVHWLLRLGQQELSPVGYTLQAKHLSASPPPLFLISAHTDPPKERTIKNATCTYDTGGGGHTCILSPTEETKTRAPYLLRKSMAPSNNLTRHTSLCLTLRAWSKDESTLRTSCLGAGLISSRAKTSVAHSSWGKRVVRMGDVCVCISLA